MPAIVALVLLAAFPPPAFAVPADPSALEVTMAADEAVAVLAILDARGKGADPDEAAWSRLFGSEGYTRLKKREESIGRPFAEGEFRRFVLSPDLAARRPALASTLEAWRRLDLAAAARRAFAYLPEGARIRAKVYPVIKPGTNSFVFETRTDPAIFLYLDPDVAPGKLENTIAHELHHIGVGAICAEERKGLPENLSAALGWMGGFAEGRAVLAAAGSPDTHPHAASDAAESAVWDRDIARVERDLRRMERFFLRILDGKLSEEERTRRGMAFINTGRVPQGPFYTLDWIMAATVERAFGRERLVASLCDPVMLLTDYNRAVAGRVSDGRVRHPVWSDSFLARLSDPGR